MKTLWSIEIRTLEDGATGYDLFADGWDGALAEAARIVGLVKDAGHKVQSVELMQPEES